MIKERINSRNLGKMYLFGNYSETKSNRHRRCLVIERGGKEKIRVRYPSPIKFVLKILRIPLNKKNFPEN